MPGDKYNNTQNIVQVISEKNTAKLAKYNPNEIETDMYSLWEENDLFSPKHEKDAEDYCIVIPPPNVTGNLHLGHALQDSIMDCLIRYHRMLGHNVLWKMGTDHAGIATQMVVERKLAAEGKSRHDFSRQDFIAKIQQLQEHYSKNIFQQIKRLGASVDWKSKRFTMDPEASTAVNKIFIDLYNKKLIYRGAKLVNWDPVLHTALSDLEVENHIEKGHLWYIKYPVLENNDEYIIVATTRPETMFGDVAVAVNPLDLRYKDLIGKKLILPLTNKSIPIIADDKVLPNFGSGCVKITPAHDFNDYEMGTRHNLPLINIFDKNACLNTNVPQEYQGLDRYEARKKIIANLEELNLIEKIEEHTLNIPRGDRSNSVIEPYVTKQWFLKTTVLANDAINAVKNDDIKFVPKQWTNTFNAWMRDIQDWCISRQILWGHQIPIWYDSNGNEYPGVTAQEVRTKFNIPDNINLTQDEDVLDTWFSASLWPFLALGWPQKTEQFEQFFPTQTLVTGFDIIFFWVARMIMMSLHITQKNPFKDVYIHGLIRDKDGQKMSKSKGNILDPLDIINGVSLEELTIKRTMNLMQPQLKEKIIQQTKKEYPQGIASFGADSLRFSLLSLATTSRDINFDLNRVEGYRNFCNKLWNAAKFVFLNCEKQTIACSYEINNLSILENWILANISQVIDKYEQHIADYRFDLLANLIYDFTWNKYCDWFIEFAKIQLKSVKIDEQEKARIRYILLYILDIVLKLLHPLIPHITEKLWQQTKVFIPQKEISIMQTKFSTINTIKFNKNEIVNAEFIRALISEIRIMRNELEINAKNKINLKICNINDKQKQSIINNYEYITTNTNLNELLHNISIENLNQNNFYVNHKLHLGGEILLALNSDEEIIKEKNRLKIIIKKQETNYKFLSNKLNNNKFVNNAPAELVVDTKQKFKQSLDKLEHAKKELSRIVNHLQKK